MEFVFDSSKKGLETVMKDYQVQAMKAVWKTGEKGIISKNVWVRVNETIMEKGESISRASIINFLNKMADKGILTLTEEPGKGGYHRVYFPAFDEKSFKELIAKHIIEKLLKEFTVETENVIFKIMEQT